MYKIQVLDPDADKFVTIHETNFSVRIVSDQFVEKIIFETDDPEYNG